MVLFTDMIQPLNVDRVYCSPLPPHSSSSPLPPHSSSPPGQFWNIPISVEPYTGVTRDGSTNVYIVTVTPPNGKQRAFPAWREDQVCATVLILLSLSILHPPSPPLSHCPFPSPPLPCIILLPINSFISSCSKHLTSRWK